MNTIEINAAGGIVINEQEEVLLIYRLGKWDFPKGKVEVGEEFDEAAIREVKEETGIKQVAIVAPINTTFHTYELEGSLMKKTTYWYLMHGHCDALLPQEDEAILEAVWVKKEQVAHYLKDSYIALQALWQEILVGTQQQIVARENSNKQ